MGTLGSEQRRPDMGASFIDTCYCPADQMPSGRCTMTTVRSTRARDSLATSAVAAWRRQPLSRRRLLQATGGLAVAAGLGAGARTAPGRSARQRRRHADDPLLAGIRWTQRQQALRRADRNRDPRHLPRQQRRDLRQPARGRSRRDRHRHALPRLREEPLRGRSCCRRSTTRDCRTPPITSPSSRSRSGTPSTARPTPRPSSGAPGR